MSRFVTRKIRNGKVKVNGHFYKVSEQHKPYNGELEGKFYIFGLYTNRDFVCLSESVDGTKAEIMENGTLPWVWWNKIDTESK